jgi:hypothetical protein
MNAEWFKQLNTLKNSGQHCPPPLPVAEKHTTFKRQKLEKIEGSYKILCTLEVHVVIS